MSSEKYTLALNVIVGAGEGPELERCLESLNAKKTFDEIVIGRTTHDDAVKRVCDRFTSDHFYHPWESERFPHGNFAAARNAVLDRTKSDYVWWVDADDAFIGDSTDTLSNMRKVVTTRFDDRDIEVWFMEYALQIDDKYRTISSIWRDRIFKRVPKFRWRDPVHELVYDKWNTVTKGNLYGARNVHLPTKPNYAGAYRNVRILEHERDVLGDKLSSRMRFFLARDMMLAAGRESDGIEVFEEILHEFRSKPEDLYALCVELAFYYAYGGALLRPSTDSMRMDNEHKIERYLRIAIALLQDCAEPYVMLGDLYVRQGHIDAARRCYACALQKKLRNGLQQLVPYYNELPSWRLADYYMAAHELEASLVFNKRARQCNPEQETLKQQRIAILAELCSSEGIKWVQAQA